MSALLNIERLSVELKSRAGPVQALDAIDLNIGPGETLCLVGESGGGKTVTAMSIARLIDHQGGSITGGSIHLGRHDLAALSQRQMNQLRGRRIGVVFQDPMTAFDPLFTVGDQVAEVLVRHRKLGRREARRQAIALLERVQLPDAALRANQHPHELSGGMRQRAMIAMALASDPQLLIADEPTTALDVTIQAQVLQLLKRLQAETGMAILLITHDLGVAASVADRIAVMYAGRIVEISPAEVLFSRPAHPYSRGLLRSTAGAGAVRDRPLAAIPGAIPPLSDLPAGCRFHPRCERAGPECALAPPILERRETSDVACWRPHDEVLDLGLASAAAAVPPRPAPTNDGEAMVRVADLSKHYGFGFTWSGGARGAVRAVDGLSFEIRAGETFGLIGESGSGKSTLGRLLLGLEAPTSGRVEFDGADLASLDRHTARALRRHAQMIFQDPYGSIDPRWTIEKIIAEPLAVHERLSSQERGGRVRDLLEKVGLDGGFAQRHPHQLSGGQRQRVAIARAIALSPRFVVADEAVSALDVSVRAQIVNLMQGIKAELGLTYLFIGHDLDLVRHVSDRVGVMYLGRLVETGPVETVLRAPAHPYTKALVQAALTPDPARARLATSLEGEMPSAANPPPGCRFHTRCPAATQRCRTEDPLLSPLVDSRAAACHYPLSA